MTIPLPVIPNTFRVSLIWNLTNPVHVPVNVIHIRATSTGVTPGGVMSGLEGSVTANMWASVWSAVGINTVNIIPLDGTSATSTFTTSGGAKWSGAVAGEGTPQVAALIKLGTGLRGRNHRGRVYLPYTAEGANGGGILIAPYQANLQTGWSTFQTNLNALGPVPLELGVASYMRDHGGTGASFQKATAITAELYTATQRRRQPGRKVSRH